MPGHVILFVLRMRGSFVASTKQLDHLCNRDNAALVDATTLILWTRRRCLCGRDGDGVAFADAMHWIVTSFLLVLLLAVK